MKKHGEAVLCLDRFEDLYNLLNNSSEFNVKPLVNHNKEIVGCNWSHLGCSVTLMVPGELDNEEEKLLGCEISNPKSIAERSNELRSKLFVPWELHLPLYIIVNKVGDYGFDSESNTTIDAWVKSFVRIIAEELKEAIGGWIPADKELVFSLDTWDFDVKIHRFSELDEIEISKLKESIEQRVLGTTHYYRYL